MDAIVILGSTFSFLFRAMVAQPYLIPSNAMAPTLESGDYIWAAKFSYGYSNYSLPYGEMLPAFTYARIGPQRGDVIVFRPAGNPSADYVMRVVGLPGDTISMKDGTAYINGTATPREAAGTYSGNLTEYMGGRLFAETLPGGRRHAVLDMVDDDFTDNAEPRTVPAGHYFVMGDNRDNSNDSRFTTAFVPEANIVGKVYAAITWPDGKFTMRDVK